MLKFYNILVLHSLWMTMGWQCRTWPPHFLTHNFLSVNILSDVTTAYNTSCLYDTQLTVLDNLFQMVACLCTVEHYSAINNLSIAAALLQLSKSGLCNLTLCYIRWHAKSFWKYLGIYGSLYFTHCMKKLYLLKASWIFFFVEEFASV